VTHFKVPDVWLCHSVSELLVFRRGVLLDNINMQSNRHDNEIFVFIFLNIWIRK
jgi:hypothetical protein